MVKNSTNTSRHSLPVNKQWAMQLALLAIGVSVATWYGWFWPEDLLRYDSGLSYGPAPDDMVIVAIDDNSVAQIGRWPWRRAIHAALFNRLKAAGARAVVLDVVISESLPIPALAMAAAQIAHPQLKIHRDGIARSVYLREGLG